MGFQEVNKSFSGMRLGMAASVAFLAGGDRIAVELFVDEAKNTENILLLSDQALEGVQDFDRSKLTYSVSLPQISAGENNIRSGANTHIAYEPDILGYSIMETFKDQVDMLRSYNQTEIRFGMPRWEGVKLSWDRKSLEWDEVQLAYFKEALEYAQGKGLEVFFLTTPPEVPVDFDINRYFQITDEFYERIGKEFPGAIHQPGNEYDVHNIFNYGMYGHEISADELEKYRQWLNVATLALRRSNPHAKITQSLTGYPMNDATINKWVRINEKIGQYVDFYSLDTYPSGIDEAKNLANLVDKFEQLTGKKDSVIAEVGLPTYGEYSQEDQKAIVCAAINGYKKAGRMTLVYQIKDEKFKDVEGHFGLLDGSGKPKPAFLPVMTALQESGNFK